MPHYYVFCVDWEEMVLMGDTLFEAESPEEAIEKAITKQYPRDVDTIEETDSMGSYAAVEADDVQHYREVVPDE